MTLVAFKLLGFCFMTETLWSFNKLSSFRVSTEHFYSRSPLTTDIFILPDLLALGSCPLKELRSEVWAGWVMEFQPFFLFGLLGNVRLLQLVILTVAASAACLTCHVRCLSEGMGWKVALEGREVSGGVRKWFQKTFRRRPESIQKALRSCPERVKKTLSRRPESVKKTSRKR